MAAAGQDPLSSLRQTATYLCHCAHSLKHLCSSFSPPAYLNTHVLENKLSINPHTQKEFCPEGEGGGARKRGGGRREREGGRKKKNEGGNCSVGRNPPSPFPGEEVD